MRIAAMRDSLVPLFSSSVAAICSSSVRIAGSLSFSSALFTSGSMNHRPRRQLLAAARRTARSGGDELQRRERALHRTAQPVVDDDVFARGRQPARFSRR